MSSIEVRKIEVMLDHLKRIQQKVSRQTLNLLIGTQWCLEVSIDEINEVDFTCTFLYRCRHNAFEASYLYKATVNVIDITLIEERLPAS